MIRFYSFACTCMAFMAPGIALYVYLKHLQRFVRHFLGPLQLHFVNPCPSDADCAVTANRKDRRIETDIFFSRQAGFGDKNQTDL